MGWKLPSGWMYEFMLSFTLIFVGYSCISYVKGVSIKSQRWIVYLAYLFIIMGISDIFIPDFLFYDPVKLEESIKRPNELIEQDTLKAE